MKTFNLFKSFYICGKSQTRNYDNISSLNHVYVCPTVFVVAAELEVNKCKVFFQAFTHFYSNILGIKIQIDKQAAVPKTMDNTVGMPHFISLLPRQVN